MSPSTKSKLFNFSGGLLTVVALLLGAAGVRYILSTDALAPYRSKGEELLRDGVTINNFELRNYVGKNLVASATVNKAVIMDDWSLIQLHGVKNGKFLDQEGRPHFFETDKATYGTYSKAVIVDSPVRVWDNHIDLKSSGFTYDHGARLVTIHGDVTGKVNGGDLVAQSVKLDTKLNKLTGSSAKYVGELSFQEAKTRSKWNIETANFELDGNIFVAYNARGNDEDMIVRADKMLHDRKNDIVTAEGNVRYWGKDANLVCEKIVIYRKEGRAILSGKKPVSMLVKAKDDTKPQETEIPPLTPFVPDEIRKSRPAAPTDQKSPTVRETDNLREYPIAIEASQIEYWYKEGSRRANITGNPWARQQLGQDEWRTLIAFRAVYDGEREILDLFSQSANRRDVRMKNSLGDDFLAETIQVSTKEGEDKLSGKGLTGVYVPQDDEEIPGRNSGGSGGGSTGGGGGTGGGLSGPIRS